MTRKEIESPVTSTIKAGGGFVDNAISGSLKRLGFASILGRAKLTKIFGAPACRILYVILLTPILKKDSTWAFCADFLDNFGIGKKDVIYRFLRRQNTKWAAVEMLLAIAFQREHLAKYQPEDLALVVDCSKKHRSGKVEGASDLWDHVERRTVRSQKVIALGLAFPKGFLPLANQMCIGKKNCQKRSGKFEDYRSEVARAYQRGIDGTPSQILAAMVKRAIDAGIKAKWLIGDCGYGLKANIALALDHGMDALFLMKRDKTVYRFQGELYNAKQLFQLFKRRMKPAANGRFRSYAFTAEINLNKKGPARWVKIQLMLSRPVRNRNKDGWVLSLCTNLEVTVDRMIELYLMRWSIEVFFKECKQHLGWLDNQSGDFVSSYASMHLSSIRYLVLLDAALSIPDGGGGLVNTRREIIERMTLLCYMGVLWEFFTGLLFGWLDELKAKLGESTVAQVKAHLGSKLDEFIDLAFQIDLNSMETAPS